MALKGLMCLQAI